MKRLILYFFITLLHLMNGSAKIGDVSDRIIPHLYGHPIMQATVISSTLLLSLTPDSLSSQQQGIKIYDMLNDLQDSVGFSNNGCEIDFSSYKTGNYDLYFVRDNSERHIGYVEVLFKPDL